MVSITNLTFHRPCFIKFHPSAPTSMYTINPRQGNSFTNVIYDALCLACRVTCQDAAINVVTPNLPSGESYLRLGISPTFKTPKLHSHRLSTQSIRSPFAGHSIQPRTEIFARDPKLLICSVITRIIAAWSADMRHQLLFECRFQLYRDYDLAWYWVFNSHFYKLEAFVKLFL